MTPSLVSKPGYIGGRRNDIIEEGESTLHIGEQTVGETTRYLRNCVTTHDETAIGIKTIFLILDFLST